MKCGEHHTLQLFLRARDSYPYYCSTVEDVDDLNNLVKHQFIFCEHFVELQQHIVITSDIYTLQYVLMDILCMQQRNGTKLNEKKRGWWE